MNKDLLPIRLVPGQKTTEIVTAGGGTFVVTSATHFWSGALVSGEIAFVLQDENFKPIMSACLEPSQAKKFVELVAGLLAQTHERQVKGAELMDRALQFSQKEPLSSGQSE